MQVFKRLLVWLFGPSLETLLSNARTLGSCTLQDEQGAGWFFSIRPPTAFAKGQDRRINTWSGRQPTVRAAVIEAIDEANSNPSASFNEVPNAPKLGGAEFDA